MTWHGLRTSSPGNSQILNSWRWNFNSKGNRMIRSNLGYLKKQFWSCWRELKMWICLLIRSRLRHSHRHTARLSIFWWRKMWESKQISYLKHRNLLQISNHTSSKWTLRFKPMISRVICSKLIFNLFCSLSSRDTIKPLSNHHQNNSNQCNHNFNQQSNNWCVVKKTDCNLLGYSHISWMSRTAKEIVKRAHQETHHLLYLSSRAQLINNHLNWVLLKAFKI